MRSYLRALPMLLLPALPIYGSLWGAYSGWTDYWLLEDGRQGVAVVTKEWTGPKGTSVGYAYDVDERNYSGLAGRNYDAKRGQLISDVHVGDRLTIYFSESHPWLSSAYRPKSRFEAVEMLAQPFLFALIGVASAGWYVIRVWNRRRAPKHGHGATSSGRFGTAARAGTAVRGWEMRVETTTSAEEVPPELRETETVSVGNLNVFTVTGADGRERTYQSLDEMPAKLRARVERSLAESSESESPGGVAPEIRQRFEAFAFPKPGQRIKVQFRGPDGREHTYHSLEELPPDVRAIYERLVNHKSGP
ncbi:MAG TPA: hypothetical protein VG055_18605 [Planctomycetaceae bacterium]|jgi:hypothetical protein|nr:hypothetical protein [Planctomycetaceae bacterium]